MTGNLLLAKRRATRSRGTCACGSTLDGGEQLLFVDVRRFGTGDVLLGSDALAEFFASRLGVEPLSPDFTAEALRAQARGRKQPVKAFLLNQERIAGVGNIYADEALFRARIHPLRPVGTLKRPQIEALRDAVVETLEAGIDAKGASIDDYRHVDGARGQLPGPLPRAHPRGRALPPLRSHDPEAARGGARNLHLPALPAAAALGCEAGREGEPAVAVGLEQLAKAADRPLAHHDLREGHLPGQRHQVGAPVRVLGEVDFA